MNIRPLVSAIWLIVLASTAPPQDAALGSPERIVDGVLLYRISDPELLSPPGPLAVQALRVDGRLMRLEIARGDREVPPRETVEAIASRRPGVVAAINGGFFSLQTGKPTDLLKVDGRLVNGTSRPRGAVAILDRGGVTTLLFDRITVDRQSVDPVYKPLLGTPHHDWSDAPHALGGAGLLMLNGRELSDWAVERISAGFETTRHPRTIIGTDTQGAIWLVTVDGRNAAVSLGMSFIELQRLSRRLGLHSVLNLDGGGSTTMLVDGKIVNHPSDPAGPRKVSDAILVIPRGR